MLHLLLSLASLVPYNRSITVPSADCKSRSGALANRCLERCPRQCVTRGPLLNCILWYMQFGGCSARGVLRVGDRTIALRLGILFLGGCTRMMLSVLSLAQVNKESSAKPCNSKKLTSLSSCSCEHFHRAAYVVLGVLGLHAHRRQ